MQAVISLADSDCGEGDSRGSLPKTGTQHKLDQTDRQTDGRTDGQTDRWTERLTDKTDR